MSHEGNNSPADDVTVCVIDEEKDVRKSYPCSRELLVTHVGYLAEVFRESNLEIKEVSIHCDINIFNWLLQWIRKADSSPEQRPVLDAGNVFPLLVSAEFLMMKALVSVCLQHIHDNINRLVLPENILQILSEDTVSRLFDTFTNDEVEAIGEKNAVLRSQFYGKLTEALVRQGGGGRRHPGASSLYRCSTCGQLVHAGAAPLGQSVSFKVWCTAASVVLSPSMDIINLHKRDERWSPAEHADSTVKAAGCARTAYWRLWGQSHFLRCSACGACFPAGQMTWCPAHRDPPRSSTPSSWTYPCCQAPTFPGDPLEHVPGCQFRDHSPILETKTDKQIFEVYSKYKELIDLPDDYRQSYKQFMFTNFIDKDKYPWWTVLMKSSTSKNYFLPNIWEIYPNKESVRNEEKLNEKQDIQQFGGQKQDGGGTGSRYRYEDGGACDVTPPAPPPQPIVTGPELTFSIYSRVRIGVHSSRLKKDVKIVYERLCIAEDEEVRLDGSESTHEAPTKTRTQRRNMEGDSFTKGNYFYDHLSVDENDSAEEIPVTEAKNQNVPRPRAVEKKTITVRRSCTGGILWSPMLPDYINIHHMYQDEQKSLARMTKYLERITTNNVINARQESRVDTAVHNNSKWTRHIVPKGGTYVRLEKEWRAENLQESFR